MTTTTTEHDVFCDCQPCLDATVTTIRALPDRRLPVALTEAAPSLEDDMTTTPTFTLADRHRIAGDLLARSDIATQGLELRSRNIDLKLADSDWGSLRALYAVLDDARVTVYEYEQGLHAFQMILVVEGKFRGADTSSQLPVFAGAELDLIRAFTADNHLNDARLLDVLIGASREG